MTTYCLTPIETNFLRSQSIFVDEVFDARKMAKKVWQAQAKRLNCGFVIGSPCKKAGHRLRTRAGHCIQCDTSKIAYQKRYREEMFLYIGRSLKGDIYKVGISRDTQDRQRNLNTQSYAGFNDWHIVLHKKVPEAGKAEAQIHALLKNNYIQGLAYEKDGHQQKSVEAFRCERDIIIEAFERIAGKL